MEKVDGSKINLVEIILLLVVNYDVSSVLIISAFLDWIDRFGDLVGQITVHL